MCIQHLPDDSEVIEQQYFDRIQKNIKDHEIPPLLAINWDWTGHFLVN